jgi:probable phosphoglycerate mutase
MNLALIRHGHVDGIVPERFRGRADLALTSIGKRQAERTAECVAAQWSPSAIYASPLRRAVQTADPIARRCGVPLQTLDAFIDVDYGDWQGLSLDEARARWPVEFGTWLSTPELAKFPRGETLGTAFDRVSAGLLGLEIAHSDETIVVVSHDSINRLALLRVLGAPQRAYWRVVQDPCGINLVEKGGATFALHAMNDTCHLADLEQGEG